MSKPFMCGDEVSVYIPDGGCDCNYTLQRVDSDQFAYAYKLMLNGSQVGDLITVPYDKYVKACELKTVDVAEIPYSGAKVGDYYLDITFYNMSDHIYVSLAAIMGGGYKIVDELPDVGDTRFIYMVEDGHGGYERYVWDAENEDWIDLGSTEIDLSNYYTKTEVDGMIQNIMLNFYPIGSLYMSVNSTDPGTLFGGTWVRIEDTFLLASGSTYPADDGTHTTATGGAASTPFTPSGTVHGTALTAGQLPNITGSVYFRNFEANGSVFLGGSGCLWRTKTTASSALYAIKQSTTNTKSIDYLNLSFGGNEAHSHGFTGAQGTVATMPPYLPVYVWKRTA